MSSHISSSDNNHSDNKLPRIQGDSPLTTNPALRNEDESISNAGVFIPIVLGMLTAFGPFLTDFYLPVLPEMSNYFHTSPAFISMSLTAGMIGLAVGQVMIGPMTDKVGRRGILIGCMLMFALASVGCIFSESILLFNIMRLFQGLAGSGGIVISKSMASDMFTGRALTKFMALLGAIHGVAPVVAPMIGGTVSEIASWQGVFTVMLVLGIILTILCFFLPETLEKEKRIRKGLKGTYFNLFKVFRNPLFRTIIMFLVFSSLTFFGYLVSSSFILQEVYNLTPLAFSICFGVNAIMIAIAAGVASKIKNQRRCIVGANIIQLLGALSMAVTLIANLNVYLLMGSYIVMLFGFGLWQPGTAAMALDSERENSGAASAIYGSSIFVAGGVVSAIVGFGDISVTSSVVMVTGALLSLCFAMIFTKIKS